MAGIHVATKQETQSGNLPGYQYYRECSCGWQCRTGSDQAANSMFANHQLHHGYTIPTKEEINEPKNSQEVDALKSAGDNTQEKKEETGGNGGASNGGNGNGTTGAKKFGAS